MFLCNDSIFKANVICQIPVEEIAEVVVLSRKLSAQNENSHTKAKWTNSHPAPVLLSCAHMSTVVYSPAPQTVG